MNTLVLAYAGASLPLVVPLAAQTEPLVPLISRDLLATEIERTLVGSMGDVTATQASTAFELRRANPLLGAAELFQRRLNVGRDHIASTVNTLVLAYAGASLPLVVPLAAQTEPLVPLISRDLLATEIERTLVGSMGIVAAVPIATGIAAPLAAAVGADGDEARGAR